MIEVMAQAHMTEAEGARDLHDVLAKAQQAFINPSSRVAVEPRVSASAMHSESNRPLG
jgi:hypothetical protein